MGRSKEWIFCDDSLWLTWCFIIVCDVWWWFVMFHGGSSWFVMFRGDSWCFVVVRHGSWCFVMVRDVSWWFVMVHVMVRDVLLSWFHDGSSWFVMFYCHGFVMVRDWFVMFYCHGFMMVRHGSWCFTVMVSWWFVMVRDVLFSKNLQKKVMWPSIQPIRVSNSLSNLIFDETSYLPLSI